MEFNPELFGHINMLYIEITINNHPIQVNPNPKYKGIC